MIRVIRVVVCGLLAAGCVARAQQVDRLHADAMAMYGGAKPYIDDPLPKLRREIDELGGLKMDEDQDELPEILERVSETVTTQLPRVPNLVAREDIVMKVEQNLMRPTSGRGGGSTMNDRQMVIISERRYEFLIRRIIGDGNVVFFKESRKEIQTEKGPAIPPQATGFSDLWMMFLPGTINEQRFRLLGTQKVHGHQTDVIAFAQLPEKVLVPARISARDGSFVPMLYQGIVWVDEDTGQILQIRIDLLAPLPMIQTDKLVSTVEFMEVTLPGLEDKLWLPRKVELQWNMYGQNAGEIHRYSNYRLYKAKVRIIDAPGDGDLVDK